MCSLNGTPSLSVRQLAPGLEVATANDLRDAFRPHKHDCYVVGITYCGLQSFRYRGVQLFELSTFPLGDIALFDCLACLADAMNRLSGSPKRRLATVDQQLADSIRDDLAEHAFSGRYMKELEKEHGLNRFAITRLFRKRFEVSPQQFIIHRRIAKARDLIVEGVTLVDAANASGFADQSHMTRHFIKTVGTTPRAWRKLASP